MKRISSKGVRPVRPLKKPTCSVGVKSSPVQWLQNSRADAAFRNGAETRRTNEDAKLARHRSQESGANRRKLDADTAYRKGPETKRTSAEARLATQRSQESGANRRKLDADTAYRKGPETKRTSAEARLAKRRSKESGANRRKLDADTTYRKGPETLLASAEAILASARAAEANAAEAVRRAEAIERRANVGRIEAEALERTGKRGVHFRCTHQKRTCARKRITLCGLQELRIRAKRTGSADRLSRSSVWFCPLCLFPEFF
jgi:hypothetical protein